MRFVFPVIVPTRALARNATKSPTYSAVVNRPITELLEISTPNSGADQKASDQPSAALRDGMNNPMAVVDTPDTEAVECKIWYSRARQTSLRTRKIEGVDV